MLQTATRCGPKRSARKNAGRVSRASPLHRQHRLLQLIRALRRPAGRWVIPRRSRGAVFLPLPYTSLRTPFLLPPWLFPVSPHRLPPSHSTASALAAVPDSSPSPAFSRTIYVSHARHGRTLGGSACADTTPAADFPRREAHASARGRGPDTVQPAILIATCCPQDLGLLDDIGAANSYWHGPLNCARVRAAGSA